MKNIMNEKLAISESNPIRARFYDYDYFKYPWHFHSEFEIMYVREGEGSCFIGDTVVPYSKGDLILFGSNLPHYMSTDERYRLEGCTLRSKGTIIQFEADFMLHSLTHYPQFLKIRKLLEDSARGVLIVTASSEVIPSLLDRIPLDAGMEQFTNLLRLLQSMAESEDRRILCSRHYADTLSPFANTRIDKIVAYLNSNYTRKIDLGEVAGMAAMNPSAFCRFFKEKTGRPFVKYIQEMRIGYACKLLLLDEMNISQIGAESGFETISHFNRTFKRLTGFTPAAYKKHMLG